MSGCFSRSIYVGNLPGNIREHEIKDLFYKYGRIVDMELKVPPRPPCYCFVEFERARAAEDATRGRDGYNFDGCRLRVELAHGGRRQSSNDRRGGYCGGGGRSAWFGGVSRRSEFRVIVRGLPSSASWQDLKDHMRKAGDVCFAEVTRDNRGTYGVVDYTNYDDMKYAIRKLDDTEFRNPWARGYIRVKKHESSQSKSPIRSRSRSHSQGRDHSSRLFQERQKNSSTTLGPSQPLSQVPESNNDAFCHMTVEKLVPENELRTMLDPKHQGNSTWFGISNNDITKFILKMLHSIFDKPYTRFKDIPSEERQMLFKMFAQKFTWDPTNTKLVEKEFEKEIALQFSYNVNRWKENWKKEKEKPKGLNESVWNKFISYWQSSDTESISKSCSENWKSDPGDKRMYIQDVWSTSCLRRNEELQKFGGVVSDHLQFLKDVDTNKKVDDIRDGFGNEIIKNMEKEVDILSQQHSQRDSCSSPELPKDEINPLEISGSKRCDRRLAKVAVSKDTTSSVKFLNCNEDLVRDNAELRKAVLELTSSLEEIKKTRLWLMNFIKSKFPELADDFANI